MTWNILFDILKSKVLENNDLNKLLSKESLKPYLREEIDKSMVDSIKNLNEAEKDNVKENIENINKKIKAGEIFYLQMPERSVKEIFEFEGMSKNQVAPITTTDLSSSFY